jgi:hypothetical protein
VRAVKLESPCTSALLKIEFLKKNLNAVTTKTSIGFIVKSILIYSLKTGYKKEIPGASTIFANDNLIFEVVAIIKAHDMSISLFDSSLSTLLKKIFRCRGNQTN